MRNAVLLTITVALLPMRSSGQELVSTLSLTAEAGYLTNTYLHPVLPLWVPVDAPFLGLAPSARLGWTGEKTYAALEGQLRLIELTDRSGLWWMGNSQARVHRSLGQTFALGLDGSASRIQMGTEQWLAWGGPYVTARFGTSIHLTMRLGMSYRRYDGADAGSSFAQNSYFGVTQLSVLPPGAWELGGYAYAAHSASQGAGPLGGGGRVSYSLADDWSLGAEVGAERFSPTMASWQSAGIIDWDMSDAVSWSARIGMQRFLNGAGSTTDVFSSVGLTYRLQHRRRRSPPPTMLWRQHGDEVVLRYRYDDNGKLFLVGDFNEWRIGETALQNHSADVYTVRLSLSPGSYEYKIIAVEDGTRRWLPLPEDALTTDDEFGGTNGILLVE